jgi:hypothetical protein
VKAPAVIAFPVESDPSTLPIVTPQHGVVVVPDFVNLQQNRFPLETGLGSDIEKKSARIVGPAFTELLILLRVDGSAVHCPVVPLLESADMQLPSHLRSN